MNPLFGEGTTTSRSQSHLAFQGLGVQAISHDTYTSILAQDLLFFS